MQERAFYQQIGAIGGRKLWNQRGAEYYRAIGKRGAQAVKTKYGVERYRHLGKKGGATTLERHGTTFYASIGAKGGSYMPHDDTGIVQMASLEVTSFDLTGVLIIGAIEWH